MASERPPLQELSRNKENSRQMTPDSDFYGTKSTSNPHQNINSQPYLRCEPPGDPETQRQWSERAKSFGKHDFEQSWAFLQNSINAYAHYMNPYVHHMNNSNPYCHYTVSYATFHVPYIQFKETRPYQYPSQLPTPPLDPSASSFMPPPRRRSNSRTSIGAKPIAFNGSVDQDPSVSTKDPLQTVEEINADPRSETSAEESETEVPRPQDTAPLDPTKRVNLYEGRRDAWQLNETVDEFLKRMPPFGNNGEPEWLWIANPYAKQERPDSTGPPDITVLKQEGQVMLDTYEPAKGRGKTEHLENFKHELLDLASELNVTSGKVC
jgi:hypothetical protein